MQGCYLRLQCQRAAWPTPSQRPATWLRASENDSPDDKDKENAGNAAVYDDNGEYFLMMIITVMFPMFAMLTM